MKRGSRDFLTSDEREFYAKLHKKEKDGRKRDRIKFIILLNDGYSYREIARILLIEEQTLRNHWESYKSDGLESLLNFNYKGRCSKLSKSEQEELEEYLSENTYITSYQIRNYIRETYNKEYSKTGVIALLLCARYTSPPPRQMRSPLSKNKKHDNLVNSFLN